MASSVFSGILRHHFQMNGDYVFDQFQDLLSTEEVLFSIFLHFFIIINHSPFLTLFLGVN